MTYFSYLQVGRFLFSLIPHFILPPFLLLVAFTCESQKKNLHLWGGRGQRRDVQYFPPLQRRIIF